MTKKEKIRSLCLDLNKEMQSLTKEEIKEMKIVFSLIIGFEDECEAATHAVGHPIQLLSFTNVLQKNIIENLNENN